jgi:hypothetical protein
VRERKWKPEFALPFILMLFDPWIESQRPALVARSDISAIETRAHKRGSKNPTSSTDTFCVEEQSTRLSKTVYAKTKDETLLYFKNWGKPPTL